jgi:hypothetical protein
LEINSGVSTMPALLPIMLTVSHVALAADRVPALNIGPGCEASVAAAVTPGRDAGACKRDEFTARDKLKQEWPRFTAEEKSSCVAQTNLGGLPSYVELLTCLEMAKEASKLNATGKKD